MKSIPVPDFSTADYIYNLFTNFRDAEKSIRFNNAAPIILNAEILYKEKAMRKELATIEENNNPANHFVNDEELVKLYTEKFVKKNGRTYYDNILKYMSFDFLQYYDVNPYCPYCLELDVGQVDHFLPKAKFPIYSVSASNLVPSCVSCNTKKKSLAGDKLFIHPYFDDVSSFDWLYMNIHFTGNIVGFTFEVRIPTDLDNYQYYKERLDCQLDELNISIKYGAKAAAYMKEEVDLLKYYFLKGEVDLLSYLNFKYKGSQKNHRNNFFASFYRALIEFDDLNEIFKRY